MASSLSDLSFMQLATAGFMAFFVILFAATGNMALIRRYPVMETLGWFALALLAFLSLLAQALNLSQTSNSIVSTVVVPAEFVLVLFIAFVVMLIKRIVQQVRNPRESRLPVILLWLGFACAAAAVLLSSSAVITLALFLSEYTGFGYILLRSDWIAVLFVTGALIAGAGGVWHVVTRLVARRNLRIRNARDAAEMRIALANQGTSQIGQ